MDERDDSQEADEHFNRALDEEEGATARARIEWELAIMSVYLLDTEVALKIGEALVAAVDDYRYRLERSETASLPDYPPNEQALMAKKVADLEEIIERIEAYFGQEK